MIERGEGLGLALEAGQALPIARKQVREDLDGDVAMQAAVAGAIDFAHSAFADLGETSYDPNRWAAMG